MPESNILLFNICLYLCGTGLFSIKFGRLNLATIGIFFYLMSSVFAFLYFKSDYFRMSISNVGKVTLEPLIWLFVFNVLLCAVLRKFEFPGTWLISNYNAKLIKKIHVFAIVVSFLIVIINIVPAINNITNPNLKDLRDATYLTGSLVKVSFVFSLLKRIFGGLSILLIVIPFFNVFVLKRINKLDLLSIIIFFGLILCAIGAYISRGVILLYSIDILLLLICLRRFFEAKFFLKIIIWSFPLILGMALLFSAITSQRFDSHSSNGANLRYAGESQLNFAIMMYDKTNGMSLGYRSLPLFRRIIGLDYMGSHGSDKYKNLRFLDRIHPYPNYIFYSVGGTYYLDFGKLMPILFLLIINLILSKRKVNRGQAHFNFYNLILAVYIGRYVIAGQFYCQYANESGNFMFMYLFMLYIILKKSRCINYSPNIKKYGSNYKIMPKIKVRI